MKIYQVIFHIQQEFFPLNGQMKIPKDNLREKVDQQEQIIAFTFLNKKFMAKRLSTAFDSVTLYGDEPEKRPDIYGKIGESGVSIATLNDMEKHCIKVLIYTIEYQCQYDYQWSRFSYYSCFFFFNTAIDQQVEKEERKRKSSFVC